MGDSSIQDKKHEKDGRSAQEKREDRFFDLVESMAANAEKNTDALRQTVEDMRGDINQLSVTAKESNVLMNQLSINVARGMWALALFLFFFVASQGYNHSSLKMGKDGIGVDLQKSISAEAATIPEPVEVSDLAKVVDEVEGEVEKLKEHIAE